MTDPARAQTVDTDIARHCAYSLPAVAFTLGRKYWPCLKQLYETLAADMQVHTEHVGPCCYTATFPCNLSSGAVLELFSKPLAALGPTADGESKLL